MSDYVSVKIVQLGQEDRSFSVAPNTLISEVLEMADLPSGSEIRVNGTVVNPTNTRVVEDTTVMVLAGQAVKNG